MSLWSRIANLFRGDRLSREIDEELQSHIEEAAAQGRDPVEARRAFGSAWHHREASRDFRMVPWLDSLRADAVFGWRQLIKRKVTSAAAILSLAVATGACTSAFRLIDALLLRPLPVAHPERLYSLSTQAIGPDGKSVTNDSWAYPVFRQLRTAVKGQAELIAVSYADRIDLSYGRDPVMEKAWKQYVSGWMFDSLGVRPALGRLFTENDDVTPGAHPYAVLSYDYWTRRFGRDPQVIGRTFRTGDELYQIVGVAQGPFTGTEPGTVTDLFVPTMMMKNNAIARSDYQWFWSFVQLKPGVAVAPVRERLRAAFRRDLLLQPAASGVSGMQKDYGTSLAALGVLVVLVLLIACANVANLMTAQASARAREMALRVSIGAGRRRLVQLVLVECAELALLASAMGALFAWWSAPFVVGMISRPDFPTRLILPMDCRVLAFGLAMGLGVTFLFGLAPALRASAMKPAGVLKGGDDPHARRRLMHTLTAVQAAFCFLVLFAGGLCTATFDRLSRQATGFSTARLLNLETVTALPQPAVYWQQVAERLRALRGVEAVAICEWPLMTGESWNGFVSTNGSPPGGVESYFLSVSPGWRELMKIPLIEGRDFRAGDRLPGAAIVSRQFARQYLSTRNPIGRLFDRVDSDGRRTAFQVVGLVADTRYRNMREPIRPVAYFPFQANYSRGTFVVRTATRNPLAQASLLRTEVARARPEFHVSTIRTEAALVQQHTIRERALALLALFFAGAALLLAGVGLYGVLDYSVLQRRREIGIRMAIGAQAVHIMRAVTADALLAVLAGAAAGLGLGMALVRYIASLLYQVKPTDMALLALPAGLILASALVAALPAVIRAVRIDPVTTLRSE